VDCADRGCATDATFDSLRCRLGVLGTAIDESADLASMRTPLGRQVGKARTLLDRSETRCGSAKRGPAKRSLRKVQQRVSRVRRILSSRHTRRSVSTAVTGPLVGTTNGLVGDARVLGSHLDCR